MMLPWHNRLFQCVTCRNNYNYPWRRNVIVWVFASWGNVNRLDTGAILHRTSEPQHAVLCTPGQGMKLSGCSDKFVGVDPNWTPITAGSSITTTTTISDRPHHHHQQQQHFNPDSNEYHSVTICPGTNHPALYSDCLYIHHIHWLCTEPMYPFYQNGNMRAQCRIRHLQPLTDCTIVVLDRDYRIDGPTPPHTNDGDGSNSSSSNIAGGARICVQFDAPLRGITRGQTAVFYIMNGLVCLGSGVIVARGPSYHEQGRPLTI
jgi:hypothetical protein